MAVQDPFYIVKDDVTQSLGASRKLYSRWRDLLQQTNTAQNEEFKWTTDQIHQAIKSIEWDLQDLDETIQIVEANRAKFKIDDVELAKRKSFIRETRSAIVDIKSALSNQLNKGKVVADQREALMEPNSRQTRQQKLEKAMESNNQNFIEGQLQVHRRVMDEQDKDMDQLETSVSTLHGVSDAMNAELKTHERLLEEFDVEVDQTNARMQGSVRRVQKLIKQSDDKGSWCCIFALVAALVVLLVVIFAF